MPWLDSLGGFDCWLEATANKNLCLCFINIVVHFLAMMFKQSKIGPSE
jgi:hypothetical protein